MTAGSGVTMRVSATWSRRDAHRRRTRRKAGGWQAEGNPASVDHRRRERILDAQTRTARTHAYATNKSTARAHDRRERERETRSEKAGNGGGKEGEDRRERHFQNKFVHSRAKQPRTAHIQAHGCGER